MALSLKSIGEGVAKAIKGEAGFAAKNAYLTNSKDPSKLIGGLIEGGVNTAVHMGTGMAVGGVAGGIIGGLDDNSSVGEGISRGMGIGAGIGFLTGAGMTGYNAYLNRNGANAANEGTKALDGEVGDVVKQIAMNGMDNRGLNNRPSDAYGIGVSPSGPPPILPASERLALPDNGPRPTMPDLTTEQFRRAMQNSRMPRY